MHIYDSNGSTANWIPGCGRKGPKKQGLSVHPLRSFLGIGSLAFLGIGSLAFAKSWLGVRGPYHDI